MIEVLLFLASQKGYYVLYDLCKRNYHSQIGCVVSFEEVDVEKSWHKDIMRLCDKYKIQFYMWNDIKENIHSLIKNHNITNMFAVSWKYLIPTSVNGFLQEPLIVLHDSLLPKYRGFAPTPAAIMCGETEIGATALFAVEDVDRGEIIKQKKIFVGKDKYMSEIIDMVSNLYADIVREVFDDIKNGKLISVPQDESKASYSIWRNIEDCHIDWNESAEQIYDFVRALGSPYHGAYTFLNNDKIIIVESEILDYDMNFVRRDAGKIWRIVDNCPEVVCGCGILRITRAVYEKNREKEVIFKKIRCRLK